MRTYKEVKNCCSAKSYEIQRVGWGFPSVLEVVREKGSLRPRYGKVTGRGGKKVSSRWKEMV